MLVSSAPAWGSAIDRPPNPSYPRRIPSAVTMVAEALDSQTIEELSLSFLAWNHVEARVHPAFVPDSSSIASVIQRPRPSEPHAMIVVSSPMPPERDT